MKNDQLFVTLQELKTLNFLTCQRTSSPSSQPSHLKLLSALNSWIFHPTWFRWVS